MATVWGGSIFRIAISATPFLLPLMFQIGFELDAYQAGLLVLAVFADNLAMKPGTTAVLKALGFRMRLVAAALVNAAMIFFGLVMERAIPHGQPVDWRHLLYG